MGLWQDSSDLGLIIDGRFSLVVNGEFFCDLTEYFKWVASNEFEVLEAFFKVSLRYRKEIYK